MSVSIIRESPNTIVIERAYIVQKVLGLLIMAVPILFFIVFMVLQPERMGKSVGMKLFSLIFILFLIMILTREFYFLYIDKSNLIIKDGERFKINKNDYLIDNLSTLLIIEYNGIGVMSNGYNIFIKLKNNKRVPISIRINKIDKEKVVEVLCAFFNINKVEEKKWWIA